MPDIESLSILIPTYNEAENIASVLRRTIEILDTQDINYEILVIDDASLDNTPDIAERVLDRKGRVVRRIAEKRSLSLSIIDGIEQAKGMALVVMDGDGSHPPELIPQFIKTLQDGYDLVVASRYVKGGGTNSFPLSRKIISSVACFLGRSVTKIKDNTSGFFCIKRSALEGTKLTPYGFKIGLEIFVKADFSAFKEIPYIFVNRKRGKSKLNIKASLEYAYQILSLFIFKMSKNQFFLCKLKKI